MADAPAPTAAEPTSTPTPAVAAPVPAGETPTPTPQPSPTAPAESPTASPAPEAKQDATPATEEPALFTLPDDVKIDDGAKAKFTTFIKSKLTPDGKVLLSSQEVVDAYLEQARDAYTLWQKQIEDQNKTNEAECKSRFTPAQLSQAETAVGFFASYDPQFRDWAKSQLNSPIFTNAMRLVGERLSEDTFEIAGAQPVTPPKKSAAERMGYTKKAN